jgi:hypothetical protein
MTRRKSPYTPDEIAAFDAGFRTASAVARAAVVEYIELFRSIEDAAYVMRHLQSVLDGWLEYQQDQDDV